MEVVELGVQCINTCRSEDQGLQEVRQRDNPSHHIITVHQHQTMHLTEKPNRMTTTDDLCHIILLSSKSLVMTHLGL